MSAYHLSTFKAKDVADNLGIAFIIEAEGRAVMKEHVATGESEFLHYGSREAAEAELGRVWDTFPTAGVHQHPTREERQP